MGDKKVVDLSRFLLFEEAGDSEADFGADDQWNYPVLLADKCNEEDDDDAESCICDGSLQESRGAQIDVSDHEDQQVHETHSDCDDADDDDYGGFDGDVDHHHHHHKMSAFKDEDEEEEEGMMVSEVASTANSYSTRKCVQSRNKSLSEMEKSRLFWEACLAS